MTNRNIIYKTNWRQITTHLFATILFILAARQFAVLNDMQIITAIDKYGYPDALKHLVDEGNIGTRLSYFVLWKNMSALIALLISFVISLILTIRNKGFWQNSIIVLLTALLLSRIGFLDNKTINVIFFSFGDLFSNLGLQYKFIANGILLTLIGTFIFLSKLTRNFIYKLRTNELDMNNVL